MCERHTNLERMQVLFVVAQIQIRVVEVFSCLLILGRRTDEQCEEHRHAKDLDRWMRKGNHREPSTYFDGLSEKYGREETGHRRDQPFLRFRVTELDASDDDEKYRHRRQKQRETVGDEETPPREGKWLSFLLSSRLSGHCSVADGPLLDGSQCLNQRCHFLRESARPNTSKTLNEK